jgi:hypothetical protein
MLTSLLTSAEPSWLVAQERGPTCYAGSVPLPVEMVFQNCVTFWT